VSFSVCHLVEHHVNYTYGSQFCRVALFDVCLGIYKLVQVSGNKSTSAFVDRRFRRLSIHENFSRFTTLWVVFCNRDVGGYVAFIMQGVGTAAGVPWGCNY
jgi:hypothetical protein